MSTASKVLLILTVLLMPVLLFYSMRTLKTYESWGTKANTMAKTLEQTEAEIKRLRSGEGEGGAPGVLQLRADLQRTDSDRGRKWSHVAPGGRPGPGGEVRVTTDLRLERPGAVPFQVAVAPDTLVYLFDESAARPGRVPGTYLGQFKVTATNDQAATLVPTEQLTANEQKRLTSRGPWTLYEQMPVDNYQTFEGLAQQDLAGLLPKESVPEYQRTGSKAQANDAPGNVWTRVEFTKAHEVDADGGKVAYEPGETLLVDRASAQQLVKDGVAKEAPDAQGVANFFQRPLRDYAFLFRDAYRQRTALQADIARDTADLASIKSAQADATKEGQFLQATIADLQADLKQLKRDAAAAKAYAEKLEGRLRALSDEVAQVTETNRELAAKLAAGQLQAAEKINEQASVAR